MAAPGDGRGLRVAGARGRPGLAGGRARGVSASPPLIQFILFIIANIG